MANDQRRGFFSSLFGKKKQTEDEIIAELESKQKLEARIQQILADRVEPPICVLAEETFVAAETPETQEVEATVELLPISASAMPRRKAPVPSVFLLSSVEDTRSYASNER